MTNVNLTFPASNVRGSAFPAPVSKALIGVAQLATKAKEAIIYASSGRELRPALSLSAIVTDTSAFYADLLGAIYYWESENNRSAEGEPHCSLTLLMSSLKFNRTTVVPLNYKEAIRSGMLTKSYLKSQLLDIYDWSIIDVAKNIQFINSMLYVG